jgi:hypothetical protein
MSDITKGEATKTVVVEIGVFSGRKNPAFELDAEAAKDLASRCRDVIGRHAIHPPPPPKLGEFYGFSVTVPKTLQKDLGLPQNIRVVHGVLTTVEDRKETHWKDEANIEGRLANLARRQDRGEFLDLVGYKEPGDEAESTRE